MEKPRVYVDTHEPISMAERLKKDGFDVDIVPLEIGDYVLPDYNIGIERKASDFQNIKDVITKATELSVKYPYHYLLVEDNFNAVVSKANKRNKRNNYFSYTGLTASLTVRGVPPLFLSNNQTLINVMEKIFIKIADGKDRVGEIKALRPTPKTEDIAVRVLMGFNGIGENNATKLLNHFGSLYNIFNASLKEIMEINGFGKNKALHIYNTIHNNILEDN